MSPVGGIYSVLKSKAQVTTAEYGASYTLLGPWNRNSVSTNSLTAMIVHACTDTDSRPPSRLSRLNPRTRLL
jgi:hypothetical protein